MMKFMGFSCSQCIEMRAYESNFSALYLCCISTEMKLLCCAAGNSRAGISVILSCTIYYVGLEAK